MKELCPCGKEAVWMRHPSDDLLRDEHLFCCGEYLKAVDGDLYEYHAQGFTRQDANPLRGINDITTFL